MLHLLHHYQGAKDLLLCMYPHFRETCAQPEQADSMVPFQNAITKMCAWHFLSPQAECIEGVGRRE